MIVNETFYKYSTCEWSLLKKVFEDQEFIGQGYSETKCTFPPGL